jgi:hypothetical protein
MNSEHRTMEAENEPYIMAQVMSGGLAVMLGTFLSRLSDCIILMISFLVWHAVI